MRGEEQTSKLFYELCALLLTILRSPHLAIPSSDASPEEAPPYPRPPLSVATARSRAARRPPVSPAGFASLLLGVSFALMLCGSVTFVIGFILMPWVIGLVMVFYLVGIVSNLSGLGRAILCPATPSPSASSPKDISDGSPGTSDIEATSSPSGLRYLLLDRSSANSCGCWEDQRGQVDSCNFISLYLKNIGVVTNCALV